MNTKVVPLVKEILGQHRPQFISLTYLSKTDKSVARYTVNLGFSYINLLRKSITDAEVALADLTPETLDHQAATEVLASLRVSLEKHLVGEQNPDYTKQGQYLPIGNGLSINTKDDSVQLFGLLQSKVVLMEGTPKKPVKSAPLTIAKNKFRKQLSISKFREFALDDTNVDTVKMNGNTLEVTPTLALFNGMGFKIYEPAVNIGADAAAVLVMGKNPVMVR